MVTHAVRHKSSGSRRKRNKDDVCDNDECVGDDENDDDEC